MGSVFKKQTTRKLPARAEVVRKGGEAVARWRARGRLRTAPVSADGTKALTESATYFAKYRGHDGVVVTRPTGCKDRQAAEQVLARWEREAEQVRAGTLDPALLSAAKAAGRPLADHLDSFDVSLVAAGTTLDYRKNVRAALERLAIDCGFRTLADVKRSPVESWMAARIGEGMSVRSRNAYREGLIAFANWATREGRLPAHDLARLPKADQKSDPRRQRRALTDAELGRLLGVAASRPLEERRTIRRGNFKGQTTAALSDATVARLEAAGRERALIYKTLLLTGLRVNELRTLSVAQLDLTPGSAHLRLDAADEKSREGNSVALRDDLADDLRAWIADTNRPPAAPVFGVPVGLLKILNGDLEAAGIPKRDDRGRTIDVHAMRTTFGTMLSRAGVAPRTAQAAMRHSDIKLTMGTYTDPRLLDTRAAVDRLPPIPLPGRRSLVAPTPYNGVVQVQFLATIKKAS